MTSPKMSAREALEIMRDGHPGGHMSLSDVSALNAECLRYARACAILAALVDEAEALSAMQDAVRDTSKSYDELLSLTKAWESATAKRRALERGEES